MKKPKTITVQPHKVKSVKKYPYPMELRVTESTHPRFVTGTRFDYGFLEISLEDGYAVNFLPIVKGDPD